MSEVETKQVLIDQAKAMGMEIDRRWSLDTLAEKVAEQQAFNSELEADEVNGSCDTWVLMIRDGFITANDRARAGTVAKIPAAMADYWYEAGVCRPSKGPVAD